VSVRVVSNVLVTVEVTVVVGGKVVEDAVVVEPDDHKLVP